MQVENPILRATTESGEIWDDPSEDLLFILLEDIRDKDELFVIVERLADASGQTYMQAIRTADSRFRLEYRDGSAGRHFFAETADMRLAHDVLTKWAFELPGWETVMPWKKLDLSAE
jgi:N6-adenosine-specific RNA methylase IME4